MDNHDGELTADLNVRLDIIRLVRDAAYMVMVPNIASDTPPLKKNRSFFLHRTGFKNHIPSDQTLR